MHTDSRGYTDAHGRPEIITDPEFKTGAATFRIVDSATGDDGGPGSDTLTPALDTAAAR